MKRHFALLCSGLPLLAACGSGGDRPDYDITCPAALVLDEASRLTRFRDGGGRDLTDVEFEAALGPVEGSCGWNDGALDAEMRVRIAVKGGPADTDNVARLTYFVAVIDRQDRVLNKAEFPFAAALSENDSFLGWDAPITLRIPLAEGQNGADFRVVAGFQLSEAELDWNADRAAHLPGQ